MIPFVFLEDVAYGRCDTLSPLIRRVIAANPGPFTYTGTGTYIVGSSAAGATVAVIDPGPDDDQHLAALLAAVQGQVVSHVLVTHTHRDHAPLARPFAAATGAVVLAAAPPRTQSHASDFLDEEDDLDFRPDRVLGDGDTICGQDWTLETVSTPGHSSNHLAFALLEESALFTGDHVMGWSTTVVAPPDGDMGAYMASLDKVMARSFSTLWPTHGAPILAPGPFLEAYRAHRLNREHQILGALTPTGRRIAEMVPQLYSAVDPRLWPAASLSVHAHLIDLVRRGRAFADPEPTLQALYRVG